MRFISGFRYFSIMLESGFLYKVSFADFDIKTRISVRYCRDGFVLLFKTRHDAFPFSSYSCCFFNTFDEVYNYLTLWFSDINTRQGLTIRHNMM